MTFGQGAGRDTHIAHALRQAVLLGGAPVTPDDHGPGVVLLADDLSVVGEQGPSGDAHIAGIVEPTATRATVPLMLAAHGLTAREAEVARLVLRGTSTRAIAHASHISGHTVQDHLKSVFDKVGVRSRRDLVGRLLGPPGCHRRWPGSYAVLRADNSEPLAAGMTRQVVVVGADATGMSAASQALRGAGRDVLRVVAFEAGHHVSYSACGIPYWVAGDVDSADDLIARSAAEHRANGIDLRIRTEITEIDLDSGTVTATDLDGGASYQTEFDELVLATGAVPVRPDLPGAEAPGIYGVQTLDDGGAVLAGLPRSPRRAVVVGGGYIGIEMAEALVRRGLAVTVIDGAPEPMSTLDPDMGALVRQAMQSIGIAVITGSPVTAFDVGSDGRVCAVVTPEGTLPADLVVLGLGVRPRTELAQAAGLPLGEHGGVLTDRRMRVQGHDGVWAGGDCVEVLHRVSQRRVHIALGTHANKHGRVIGTNLGGGYATFPGVVGTAVSKVCDLEVSRTGLLEAEARAVGFAPVSVTVQSTTRAGYFPGAGPITVKMTAERGTGRLLGAQLVGREGSGKRIDVCAVALWNEMTVEEMTGLDLGYAPPFSPVWDPVLVAARKAAAAV
jgi:NADPH-dependent 2,4-dienoyl-CoA reductase/sulfur reductase-like enzyme/DNA-binding CsgD family transcriptional regulator